MESNDIGELFSAAGDACRDSEGTRKNEATGNSDNFGPDSPDGGKEAH